MSGSVQPRAFISSALVGRKDIIVTPPVYAAVILRP
jgi:hypothetical protein